MRRVLGPLLFVLVLTLLFFAGKLWHADPVERADGEGAGVAPLSDPPPAVAVAAPAPAASPSTSPAVISAGAAAEETRGRLNASAEDLRLLAQNSGEFLAAQGATAFNLLAAFAATGDRALLEQALERFPRDPAVLLVALGDEPRGESRSAMIERFKAADPDNPLPYIFSAADLFEDGRAEDAIAELREALERPAFYTYFNERAAALRELALRSGTTEFAAESVALFSQPLPHLQAAMRASRGLHAWVDAQIAAGGEGSIDADVKLLFGLGRMFQTPEASRLLVGQLVGVALERKALEVAGKLEANPLPVEPAARAEELNQLRDEAKTLSTVAGRVFADPALWQGYFARFRADGELAALRWVQQQPAGAAAAPEGAAPSAVKSALGR